MVGLDEIPICRDVHPMGEDDDIPHQNLVLVHLGKHSIPHCGNSLPLVGYLINFYELPLFLIVVDGCYKNADGDSQQYHEPLKPSQLPVVAAGCPDLISDELLLIAIEMKAATIRILMVRSLQACHIRAKNPMG